MNILQRFRQFVQQENLFDQRDKLLLAVSGGVDSIVLCELCHQANYDFAIAHCNFQLRGEESERDQTFVTQLAEKYKVEIKLERFDTLKYADESKKGIQEAARDLRYSWFAQIINENPESETRNPKIILTAHHADDNVETVIMNFCRGTGLAGLEGIPLAQSFIKRPLLGFWKTELLAFAKENNLQWVEDSSNLTLKYTRNFFRNEIIPAIKKVYPHAEENLIDNIRRFKGINRLYSSLVEGLKEKLCKSNEGEVRIPVKELMRYQGTSLLYEIIKDYDFGEKQVDELIKLATAGSGKFIQNERYQVIKHRNWFIIAPRSESGDTIVIEKDDTSIQSRAGTLQLKFAGKEKLVPGKSGNVAQLDAKDIEFPLLLRKWKQGDYFYPLGIRKKKKLSRFFIDQKLPRNRKENVYVIESAGRIIWVVGLRIDDRFKITDKTRNILKISLETG